MKNGRSWAEVDLSCIVNNYNIYKRFAGKNVMAVVKANAYGHGSVAVAKALQDEGVDLFAVAAINEAIELRENGIKGLILILGYTPPEKFDELLKYDISQSIISEAYFETMLSTRKEYKVHVALDTGMNRIGIKAQYPEHCEEFIRKCSESMILEGVFTHLCVADTKGEEEVGFTKKQIALFDDVLERVSDLDIPYRHCANSAGGLTYESRFSNMDRLGIILYGLKPDNSFKLPEGIRPAMIWKSVVTMRKHILAGETVGYGRTFTADKDMDIGIISTGYADGYNRLLSNKGYVLYNGEKLPIIGRVCMDQFMVDLKDSDAKQGDKVYLIDTEKLTADDMANMTGTIGYEIVCDISERVPRYYSEGE